MSESVQVVLIICLTVVILSVLDRKRGGRHLPPKDGGMK